MCGILLGGFMTLKNYCDCSREIMETKWLKAQGRRFRKNGQLDVHLIICLERACREQIFGC